MGIPDGKKYQEIGISQLVQRFYFCIVVFKGIRNPDLEAGKEAPDRRDADGETRLTRPMQARSVGNFLLAGSTEAAKTKQDKTRQDKRQTTRLLSDTRKGESTRHPILP